MENRNLDNELINSVLNLLNKLQDQKFTIQIKRKHLYEEINKLKDIDKGKNIIIKDYLTETFFEILTKYFYHKFDRTLIQEMVTNKGEIKISRFFIKNSNRLNICKFILICCDKDCAKKFVNLYLIKILLPDLFKNIRSEVKIDRDKFLKKFKCQIIGEDIPKEKLLNSENKNVSNFDVKNDLLVEIEKFYQIKIYLAVTVLNNNKREIYIYKNDNENRYFFEILSIINKEFLQDFIILKFLEIEFKELFEWILKMKYEIN